MTARRKPEPSYGGAPTPHRPNTSSNGGAPSAVDPAPGLLRLPSRAESASRARRYVRDRLAELGRTDLEECAVLGVGELVANVWRHARTPVLVTVRPTNGRTVRIEVTDYSASYPVRKHAATSALNGRGLALLDACGAWGVSEPPRTGAKTIWFEPFDAMP